MVRWNLAVVVGVPGVGKTSLCRHAAQCLGYNYINYGELMLHVAKEQKKTSTQMEMFKLPLDSQEKIWRKAASLIKDEENVLLDLHGVDRSWKGYLISLPLETLSPDIIILVESSVDNIIRRRISDQDKSRHLEDMNSLKENIKLLRITTAICSVISGSYFVILENNDFDMSLNQLKTYL